MRDAALKAVILAIHIEVSSALSHGKADSSLAASAVGLKIV